MSGRYASRRSPGHVSYLLIYFIGAHHEFKMRAPHYVGIVYIWEIVFLTIKEHAGDISVFR